MPVYTGIWLIWTFYSTTVLHRDTLSVISAILINLTSFFFFFISVLLTLKYFPIELPMQASSCHHFNKTIMMTGRDGGLTLTIAEAVLSPWSSAVPPLKRCSRPWANSRWHSSFASSSADPSPPCGHSQSNRVRPENRKVMTCKIETGLKSKRAHFSVAKTN